MPETDLLATVRLTPEQREELDRALGRLIVWLARVLHIPWWASFLLLLALLIVVLAATLRAPKKKPSATRKRMPADTQPVHDFAFCGHCGYNVPQPGAPPAATSSCASPPPPTRGTASTWSPR